MTFKYNNIFKEDSVWLVKIENEEKQADKNNLIVSINTYYEHIHGNSYLNKNLIGLIQDAFMSINIGVIMLDIYSDTETIINEERASLEQGVDYVLVDNDAKKVGEMRLCGDWGDEDDLFIDRYLIEISINNTYSKKVIDSLKAIMVSNQIDFKEFSKKFVRKKGVLDKIKSFFLDRRKY